MDSEFQDMMNEFFDQKSAEYFAEALAKQQREKGSSAPKSNASKAKQPTKRPFYHEQLDENLTSKESSEELDELLQSIKLPLNATGKEFLPNIYYHGDENWLYDSNQEMPYYAKGRENAVRLDKMERGRLIRLKYPSKSFDVLITRKYFYDQKILERNEGEKYSSPEKNPAFLGCEDYYIYDINDTEGMRLFRAYDKFGRLILQRPTSKGAEVIRYKYRNDSPTVIDQIRTGTPPEKDPSFLMSYKTKNYSWEEDAGVQKEKGSNKPQHHADSFVEYGDINPKNMEKASNNGNGGNKSNILLVDHMDPNPALQQSAQDTQRGLEFIAGDFGTANLMDYLNKDALAGGGYPIHFAKPINDIEWTEDFDAHYIRYSPNGDIRRNYQKDIDNIRRLTEGVRLDYFTNPERYAVRRHTRRERLKDIFLKEVAMFGGKFRAAMSNPEAKDKVVFIPIRMLTQHFGVVKMMVAYSPFSKKASLIDPSKISSKEEMQIPMAILEGTIKASGEVNSVEIIRPPFVGVKQESMNNAYELDNHSEAAAILFAAEFARGIRKFGGPKKEPKNFLEQVFSIASSAMEKLFGPYERPNPNFVNQGLGIRPLKKDETKEETSLTNPPIFYTSAIEAATKKAISYAAKPLSKDKVEKVLRAFTTIHSVKGKEDMRHGFNSFVPNKPVYAQWADMTSNRPQPPKSSGNNKPIDDTYIYRAREDRRRKETSDNRRLYGGSSSKDV